jgi:hypothetical protein
MGALHHTMKNMHTREHFTHKNPYMGPLCITDLEYVGHNEEILSFGQFLPQTGNFQ